MALVLELVLVAQEEEVVVVEEEEGVRKGQEAVVEEEEVEEEGEEEARPFFPVPAPAPRLLACSWWSAGCSPCCDRSAALLALIKW